jgi:formylglycine-generating enzyme required for sulfatase activity/uncharacterized caspase-like protein
MGRRRVFGLVVVLGMAIVCGAAAARAQSGLGAYHALIIANQQYEHLPSLETPLADAGAVADVLRDAYGFSVRVLQNATRAQIVDALAELRGRLRESDNLLIYYAGHGYLDREADRGYWMAADAVPGSPTNWVSNGDVTDVLRAMRAKHVLIVADSCYSGTLTRDIAIRAAEPSDVSRLAQRRARTVLTSGGLEPVADRGGSGHSVFARAFLDALRENTGATDATSLFAGLRRQVLLRAEQTPQYADVRFAGHDGGDFVFARTDAPVAAATPPAPPTRPAAAFTVTKEVVLEYGTLAIRGRLGGIEVWLDDEKVGITEAGTALVVGNLAAGRYTLKARKDGHDSWQRAVEVAANERSDVVIDIAAPGPPVIVRGADGADMVLVPAGEFWMGSTPQEIDRAKDECRKVIRVEASCRTWMDREAPRHRVYLDGYYIDRYEVTNERFERFVRATGHRTTAQRQGEGWAYQQKDGPWQWLKVSGASWRTPAGPGTTAAADHPVVQVSWDDARAYCSWVGKRLPTEAEWEKAARGADGRRYPWGDDWHPGRANGELNVKATRPVGLYEAGASPYRAHDMAGNVWEWVADWFGQEYYWEGHDRNPTGPASGDKRVLRGGAWINLPVFLRATVRSINWPDYHSTFIGFRCARGL